jgi:hypothetical protein
MGFMILLACLVWLPNEHPIPYELQRPAPHAEDAPPAPEEAYQNVASRKSPQG